MTAAAPAAELWSRVGAPHRAVAVVAHPDDESFGLGAVLSTLALAGTAVSVVCFTHGEASTLGANDSLGDRRGRELRDAASALGVSGVALFDFPDGALETSDQAALEAIVEAYVGTVDLLVVFEPGGVTGHPDHRRATEVAERVAFRHHLPVLEWGVAPVIANALRDELGAPFVAIDSGGDGVFDIVVDRTKQRAAIACHGTQATGNTVLARRLEMQGDSERVRYRSVVTEERCRT